MYSTKNKIPIDNNYFHTKHLNYIFLLGEQENYTLSNMFLDK